MFIQNTLKRISNYINSFLEDSDQPSPKPRVLDTKSPEPKLESYFSINGHKFELMDSDKWYNSLYFKFFLYLAASAGVIFIVWYNGDTIKEWTLHTSSVTFLISIISKLLSNNRKPGNPPTDKGKAVDRDIELNDINESQGSNLSNDHSLSNNVSSSNPIDEEITPRNSPIFKNINLEKEVFAKPEPRTVISKAYPGDTPEERQFNELFNVVTIE
jgi:hypothetical protein